MDRLTTAILRNAVASQSTPWLTRAVTSERETAIGWHDADGNISNTGARCIAVIRAELTRRGIRA